MTLEVLSFPDADPYLPGFLAVHSGDPSLYGQLEMQPTPTDFPGTFIEPVRQNKPIYR